MAQWLRALVSLPEVLSSIPSNHMVADSQKYKTLLSYYGNTWWANEYIHKRDCSNEKYTQKFSSCMTIDGKAIRMNISNLLDIHCVFVSVSVCECSMYIYLSLHLSPGVYVCVCMCVFVCERERESEIYTY